MKNEPRIIKVEELLKNEEISIPSYQRPYKWTAKNVHQLIDDIQHHGDKSAYRLGTIVFHRNEEGKLDIVDGQQRTITLLLIALAIHNNDGKLAEGLNKGKIEPIKSALFNQLSFSNPITQPNIQQNYLDIARRVVDFQAETVKFLYERCELVQVELEDISEAFQFFDSQNARGKDLEPHDLLKAFHLREMAGSTTEAERMSAVEQWEGLDTPELKKIFSHFLFPIRQWAKGHSARHFSKNEVGVFKGMTPTIEEPFPFTDLYRIGHFYVEGYNQEYHRNIDRKAMAYPFQIDQIIINGKRFFELVNHYKAVIKRIEGYEGLNEESKKILNAINNYDGKGRTGDKYVRNLFDCCLLYYWDKFGEVDIDRAIEKFFVWAYSLRLRLYNVQQASMDIHALESPHLFKTIREALHPSEVLNVPLGQVELNMESKTGKIIALFQELKYLPDASKQQ